MSPLRSRGVRTTARSGQVALTVAALLLSVTGCGSRDGPAPATALTAPDAAAAALADYYVRDAAGVPVAEVPPETRARLLADLRRLQAAAALGADKVTPAVLSEIELSRLQILARSAAESAGVFAQPTELELEAAYRDYVLSLPPSEFHVQHILVATEALAATVIAALDGGAEFAALAAERSADDSRTRGGDLGWISPGTLPPQIFTALRTLAAGDYTRQPVHTAYGWHVLKLVEQRPGAAPAFEQVRAQLAVNLQEARYRQFLAAAQAPR